MPYICDENGENCEYFPDVPDNFDQQLASTPQPSFQGYYDEITGRFIPTSEPGFPMLSETSGTSPKFDADWSYDPTKQTWTDSQGKSYDMSYLSKNPSLLDKAVGALKNIGGKAMDFAGSNQGIMAILAALAAYSDRAKPSGGGTALAYAGPKAVTRSVSPGAYGPIAKYAAEGGLMQAYAQGGQVQMEDGGFVMTKRAVDGAGGPRGIQQLVPGARMIRGPGTGTSDDIPAYIQGPNGRTPAKLSNGEAYVPPGRDTKGLYALMHKLERKA